MVHNSGGAKCQFSKLPFPFSCEEDILSGVQFLLSEESLQRLIEDDHKNPGEELTREEKADLEVCEDSLTTVEVTPSEGDTDRSVEEGTHGGYFELIPVSNPLLNVQKGCSMRVPALQP